MLARLSGGLALVFMKGDFSAFVECLEQGMKRGIGLTRCTRRARQRGPSREASRSCAGGEAKSRTPGPEQDFVLLLVFGVVI